MPATTPTLKTPTSRVLARATDLLRNLLDTSGQSMYVFLDDRNKVCNARFAKLLGYGTPEAWAAVQTSFPQAFVAPDSQELLVETYQDAMQNGNAGQVPITWKRKDGRLVETAVILVPMDVEGQRVAVHFIDEA